MANHKGKKLNVCFGSTFKNHFKLTKDLNIKAEQPGANVATYWHGLGVKKGLHTLTVGRNSKGMLTEKQTEEMSFQYKTDKCYL